MLWQKNTDGLGLWMFQARNKPIGLLACYVPAYLRGLTVHDQSLPQARHIFCQSY